MTLFNISIEAPCRSYGNLYCYALAALFVPILLLFLISITFMFPVYAYVFRANQEKDRKVSLYYITDHFHTTANVMQIFFYFILIVGFFIWPLKDDPKLFFIVGTFFFLTFMVYTIIVTVTMMSNLLLSSLGFQRFLLFYFPQTEKFILIRQKTVARAIIFIYPFLFVLNAVVRGWKLLSLSRVLKNDVDYYTENKVLMFLDSINTKLYFLFNGMFIVSTLLYYPILRKVKKMSNLQSVKKNDPGKYISYQTKIVFLFKLFYFPNAFLLTYVLNHPLIFNEDVIYGAMVSIDLLTTHFIIQASYLFCNKSHYDSIFNCCSCKSSEKLSVYLSSKVGNQVTTVIETPTN